MIQMAAYGRLGQGSSGASGIDVRGMAVNGPGWISVEMARPEGQSSNSFQAERLLSTLAEWNEFLKARTASPPRGPFNGRCLVTS